MHTRASATPTQAPTDGRTLLARRCTRTDGARAQMLMYSASAYEQSHAPPPHSRRRRQQERPRSPRWKPHYQQRRLLATDACPPMRLQTHRSWQLVAHSSALVWKCGGTSRRSRTGTVACTHTAACKMWRGYHHHHHHRAQPSRLGRWQEHKIAVQGVASGWAQRLQADRRPHDANGASAEGRLGGGGRWPGRDGGSIASLGLAQGCESSSL